MKCMHAGLDRKISYMDCRAAVESSPSDIVVEILLLLFIAAITTAPFSKVGSFGLLPLHTSMFNYC